MLTFSLIETEGFQEWLNEIDPSFNIPDRETIKNKLPEWRKKVEEKIKQLLDSVDFVNISLDGWSDKIMRSFVGYIVQFINNEWEMQTIPFAFEYMTGLISFFNNFLFLNKL